MSALTSRIASKEKDVAIRCTAIGATGFLLYFFLARLALWSIRARVAVPQAGGIPPVQTVASRLEKKLPEKCCRYFRFGEATATPTATCYSYLSL
jgi:hypothetical protein